MNTFSEEFGFDTEELLTNSYPPAPSSVPGFLNATYHDLQIPANPVEYYPSSMINFSQAMEFTMSEPSMMHTSQTPFQLPLSQSSGGGPPIGFHNAAALEPFQQPETILQSQHSLSDQNFPSSQYNTNQTTADNRTPKNTTVPAKKWKPAESRIRQLYVHEGLSIDDLRKVINEEFGFNAK